MSHFLERRDEFVEVYLHYISHTKYLRTYFSKIIVGGKRTLNARVHVCVYVRVGVCVRVYLCVCVCVYVCVSLDQCVW